MPRTRKTEALGSDMRSFIKDVARETFLEMMTEHDLLFIPAPRANTPPEPTTIKGKGKGRKENRQYDKLSITLDKEIARLIHKEARRSGLSVGKLLDQILWERYGRPRLSYMEEPKQ